MVPKHKVVKGQLHPYYRTNPNRVAPKNSRRVLESGTAVKTVYLSKAPLEMDHEALQKALDYHERRMFIELQRSGRIVRKVIRTLTGQEGDVRIQMLWEILGTKDTKHTRKRAKLNGNAGALVDQQGSSTEPGRTEAQAGGETGPL